jgi:hypothetical protein
MLNIQLIFLSYMLALVGGTGLYVLSPLLMNLIYFICIITIFWIWFQRYKFIGLESIEFNSKKMFILLVYICFLLAYFLRESLFFTESQFQANEGIIRGYTDLFRGLVSFIISTTTYRFVKNSKALVVMPLICLLVIIIGIFLEINQVIDFNSDVNEENDQWVKTTDDKLLARPGGFLNSNMTAALALMWLFMALESKIHSSILIKVLVFILTITVCLLTQSRAALLFLTMYVLYKLIVLRNFNFLISIVFFGLVAISVAYYFELEILQQLIEKFTSRADSNEDSARERVYLIGYSIDSFFNAPIFGNGIRYVANTAGNGNSSHNQILEVLTNFGLIGFFMVSALYLTFYHKNSLVYLILCIFPTLFFSHNFFENSAYQITLAFVYTLNSKEEKTEI